MPPVIELTDVHKTFRRKVQALRGVTMRVDPGEIFCLLGPNGAGKSTLVKILMSVIHASSMSGTMLGRSIGHKPTLRRVGYLPEHHRFPRFLTAQQALHYYGALCGMRRKLRNRRIDEMLDLVGMASWRRHRVGTFSKGMQQRIGLAQALLHDPELLLLDEPTDGVDPVGRREIRDLLMHLRSEGRTVLVNSHILAELEAICDRVSILVKGKVALEGTVDDLTRDRRRWVVGFDGPPPQWAIDDDEVGTMTDAGRGFITLIGAQAADVQPVLDRLRGESRTIIDVREVRESLEDLFMRALANAEDADAARPGAVHGKQVTKP